MTIEWRATIEIASQIGRDGNLKCSIEPAFNLKFLFTIKLSSLKCNDLRFESKSNKVRVKTVPLSTI